MKRRSCGAVHPEASVAPGDPGFGRPFVGDPFVGDPFVGDPFVGDPFDRGPDGAGVRSVAGRSGDAGGPPWVRGSCDGSPRSSVTMGIGAVSAGTMAGRGEPSDPRAGRSGAGAPPGPAVTPGPDVALPGPGVAEPGAVVPVDVRGPSWRTRP
jgi:hypothetical protein